MGRRHLGARRLALTEQIRQIFEESEQTYGSPRIFKELKLGRGTAIGEKRVARLMRQAGLVSIHAKKRKGSTTGGKEHRLAPDLVGRDFSVDAPDRLWVADLTQLTTWQDTCYVAVVADAYSRCASAGAFVPTRRSSSRSKRWTWRSGDAARCVRPAPSITATKGSQYTSFAFTRRLAAEGPRRQHGHRRRRPRQRDAFAQRGRLYGPRLTLLP